MSDNELQEKLRLLPTADLVRIQGKILADRSMDPSHKIEYSTLVAVELEARQHEGILKRAERFIDRNMDKDTQKVAATALAVVGAFFGFNLLS